MEETNLTINNLIEIINMIDLFAERGAVKGNELLIVGKIRAKIEEVVNNANRVTEANKEETP